VIVIRADGTPSVAPADLTTPSARRAYKAAVKAAARAESKRIRTVVQAQKLADRLRRARGTDQEET